MTIPEGRAADWHQRIGTYENLPPPKHVAHRKSLPQPVWELRLNPDYGTLPGIPFLEALQGVGAVGADMPAYADRLMRLNIYVSSTLPAFKLRNDRFIDVRYIFSGPRWDMSTMKNGLKVSILGRCRSVRLLMLSQTFTVAYSRYVYLALVLPFFRPDGRGLGIHSELDRGSERSARNGRFGHARTAWESASANFDLPDFIPTTMSESIRRSWS